jgi:DNA processing protein
MASVLDWLALSLVPGLGPAGCRRLLDHFDSPAAILFAPIQELHRVPGMQARQVAPLVDRDGLRRRAEEELGALRRVGGSVLTLADDAYPQPLRQLSDPPPVLYVLGNRKLPAVTGVAVVGSRAATTYGRRVAFSLARELAAQGVTVTSGLALGIDSEAHAGAVAGGGTTVAVLGCGLDVVYPLANRQLYRKIAEAGTLLSEYPLGTKPEGFRFPARNRIIAGLSSGVVVVEATRKSGSLITAQIALDYGREVFAVPGQVDSCKSEGTHWLLQQGARLVQGVDDILSEIGRGPLGGLGSLGGDTGQTGALPSTGLDPAAVTLLEVLETYPQGRDELIEKTAFSPARVSELLLFLEIEGLVEILPGNQVRKTRR